MMMDWAIAQYHHGFGGLFMLDIKLLTPHLGGYG